MSTFAHTDELKLDLSAIPGKRSDLTIYAKQEDNTRRVQITLQENGENYTIPDGVSVLLRALKPDGHFVLTDLPFDGCRIYLTLPREMLTCAGCVRAEICLTAGEEILTSATFYVEVVPIALSDTASGNDLSALAEVMNAAVVLTEQALVPVAVETVATGNGFDPSALTHHLYQAAPDWQVDHYEFEGSGTQYSNAHSAFAAGYVYFAGDDRTSYCKLIGSGSICTGYVCYRPLGVSGGTSPALRSLLDGETVEERALPTAVQLSRLNELIAYQNLSANSTTYHLVEQSLLVAIYGWIQILFDSLAKGIAVDMGAGTKMRFVTEEELAEINRRLSDLEN
ncbi:MAG: BppU family phage baseplate upper protein [Clostridia bacterium]|nr:BppU family phage baseplate upper protein [Clostridia bacterium]